jgi:hypothetical protein
MTLLPLILLPNLDIGMIHHAWLSKRHLKMEIHKCCEIILDLAGILDIPILGKYIMTLCLSFLEDDPYSLLF